MPVTDNIKQLMAAQSIKEHELARQVGISQPAINKIVQGKTTRSRYLPDIAKALGVTLEELQAEEAINAVSLDKSNDKKVHRELEQLIPKLTQEEAQQIKRLIEIVMESNTLLDNMNKRRPLTKEESNAAHRLKQAWQHAKKTMHLNQEEAAHRIGITQGGFSHYINAQTPLNMKALLDICSLIQANPYEIYPELMASLDSTQPTSRLNQLFKSLDNEQQALVVKIMEDFNQLNTLKKSASN